MAGRVSRKEAGPAVEPTVTVAAVAQLELGMAQRETRVAVFLRIRDPAERAMRREEIHRCQECR